MRLTVLGKSPAWSDAGGACSGYLVEGEGGRPFLVDCGNGVFGKLRLHRDYRDVEAVVISHLHGDHLLDLVPFSYALTVGPSAGRARQAAADRPERSRFVLPPPGRHLGRRGSDLDGVRDRGVRGRRRARGLRRRGAPACRSALRADERDRAPRPGGGRIVFGADGRLSDRLVAAACGAEVLIAEATLPQADPAPIEQRGHMSAREAGELAERAGVGRLVLTHISDELDPDHALAEAGAAFAGPVEIAAEGPPSRSS